VLAVTLCAVLCLPSLAFAADSADSFAAESPLAAGGGNTCAVTAAGAISCWGDSSAVRDQAPAEGKFLSLSVGAEHACAIRSDGGLACWGDDAAGESEPPIGEFTAVAVGAEHGCAIRADGSLACWGDDSSGQLDGVPEGRFTDLSAGGDHSCAIRAGGALSCWGSDAAGESDPPTGRFVAVAVGAEHSCAIRVDGSLACWGEDSSGQLDGVPEGRFRTIAAGGGHSCAIRADGSLACWGSNAAGESEAPDGSFRWVAAGSAHGCAVRADGGAVCWGSGQAAGAPPAATAIGHLPLTTGIDSNYNCAIRSDGRPQCWGADSLGEPVQAAAAENTLAISAEDRRTCVLTASGEAECWGAELSEPPPSGPFRSIASTVGDSCAIRADGNLACWGDAGPLLSPPSGAFRSLTGGDGYACGVRADGTLACWGEAGAPTLRGIPEGSFRSVSAGSDRACGLRGDGTLACWGSNGLGYLAGAPAGAVRSVAAGAYHACAVLGDGQMTCWENGETVGALEGAFYSLSAGANHTCAERDDGRVTCLGHDEFGQALPRAEEATLPRAILGTLYSEEIAASPEGPRPEFTVSGGGLPPGLALSPDGVLSGAPAAAGDYRFEVVVDDGISEASEAEMSLAVVGEPTLRLDAAQVPSSESAVLGGSVEPQNLAAEAWFEYWPASGSSQEAIRTPVQPIERGTGLTPISATLAGLAPEGQYRYRLSGSDELGPDAVHSETGSFSTGLPPPVAGENFNVETVAGTVSTKCPADQSFTGLVRAEHLPVGCLIDTTQGTVRITLDKGEGVTQNAIFWGGVFRVGQAAGVNRTAVMKLVGQLRCERRTSDGRLLRRRHGGGRRLWGSGEGNYKTVGDHGAATVRGTIWLVQDRCDGSTLIKVKRGTVWVEDFVKGTNVVVHEGRQYVIEPPTARLGG
jgi:alpha-tubulin suppressor-like RCC1 family protein